MTTAAVNHVITNTSNTGNTATFVANTISGVATDLAMADIKCTLRAVGDVHGMVLIPIADPATLEGCLMPADLKTAQIEITEGGAGAACAVIVEEIRPF